MATEINIKGARVCLLTAVGEPILRLYKQHNQNLSIFGDRDFIDCEIHHPDIFFNIDEDSVVYKEDGGKNIIDIQLGGFSEDHPVNEDIEKMVQSYPHQYIEGARAKRGSQNPYPERGSQESNIMKATDYLFAIYQEGRYADICIVSREYWNENKSIDDKHFDGSIDSILPKGFDEVSEATFHYYGPLETAISLLREAGFEQIPDESRP